MFAVSNVMVMLGQAAMLAYLLQSLLHLLEVGLLVKAGRSQLCRKCLEHIGKEEE